MPVTALRIGSMNRQHNTYTTRLNLPCHWHMILFHRYLTISTRSAALLGSLISAINELRINP